MKHCPNGHEVGDNVKFCPECGAEIIDNGAKFCAKCGNERRGAEKYCSQCGSPYDQTPSSSDIQVSNSKSKKGWLVAAVICLLALAIGGAAWYYWGKMWDPNNKYSLEELAKAAVNYDYIEDFHDGLALVSKGGKIGFIDKMGNEVIPCIYDDKTGTASFFSEGLAFVVLGDKITAIDKEGNKVFDINCDEVKDFSNGLAAVCKDGKWGYIDKNGKEIIKCSYDNAFSFSEGFALVSREDKYGYVDVEGNIAIPIIYEWTGDSGKMQFHEGLVVVRKNDKEGYINASGEEIIPCVYQSAGIFSEGIASVQKEEKWGCIDKKGNIVFGFTDEYYIAPFKEGIAWKDSEDGYVAINSKNEVLFTCNHEIVYPFHDGFAVVSDRPDRYTSRDYLIDKNGKMYFTQTEQEINNFSEGLAIVQKNGIYGFVDKKGNSTFDLQNEKVKTIVQAKIQEKEDKRKQEEEEQRKAEEERKRIEEENNPQNLFYKLANRGIYVWSYDFHKDTGFGGKEHSCMFFFYPESPTTGRLSYNELHWDNDPSIYSYGVHTAFYTVTDENIIRATFVRNQGDPRYFKENQTILLRMEKKGDEIAFKEISGYQYLALRQKEKTRKDHAR